MRKFKLRENAIYWELPDSIAFETEPDSYIQDERGYPTLQTARELKCKWEDTQTEVLNNEGEKVLSKSTVYLNDKVTEGSFMLREGDLSTAPENPQTDTRVKRIASVSFIKSLRGDKGLYTAYLV